MSVEEIIEWMFGGQVDASKIISIIVAIYAVVKSITEWVAKKKLIKAGLEQSALLEELKASRAENEKLRQGLAKLGDVVITSYLSSNTISPETKKHIGHLGNELNQLAAIPLSETTNKLIEAVTLVAPQNDLNEHKEEIVKVTEEAEKEIDAVNEAAQDAIEKIKIS